MKKILLIVHILILLTLIPHITYANQYWFQTHMIKAYDKNSITNDKALLFEGKSTDIICLDTNKQILTIYYENKKTIFNILEKIDDSTCLAVDEKKRPVYIHIRNMKRIGDNFYMIVLQYETKTLTYLMEKK